MDNKQFEELKNLLKSMDMKLDLMVKVLKVSMPKPKITPEERKILKLCDKKHTIDDIVQKIGKTRNSIDIILTQLRSKAIIKSVKIKGKLVYGRI